MSPRVFVCKFAVSGLGYGLPPGNGHGPRVGHCGSLKPANTGSDMGTEMPVTGGPLSPALGRVDHIRGGAFQQRRGWFAADVTGEREFVTEPTNNKPPHAANTARTLSLQGRIALSVVERL